MTGKIVPAKSEAEDPWFLSEVEMMDGPEQEDRRMGIGWNMEQDNKCCWCRKEASLPKNAP